jgi:hypothetical protein
MEFVIATEGHEIPDRPPVSLAVGEVVTVDERRDSDWPAFVFVSAANGLGWMPSLAIRPRPRAGMEEDDVHTALAARDAVRIEIVVSPRTSSAAN